MIRPFLSVIGLPPLIVFGGLIYSSAFIRSSHYGSYFLFCIGYGLFCYLLFRLSRCGRSSAIFWIPVMIVAWLGPFVLGHYYGYRETRYIVWRMVQNDTAGKFNPAWKDLDRDRVFDLYAESFIGGTAGGFSSYLRLMAHEGWSGFERAGGIGSIYIQRKGIWVWVAWGMHLVFLFIATGVAMGATIPDEALTSNTCPPAKEHKAVPNGTRSPQKEQTQKNAAGDGESIRTVARPENEKDPNGWWLIKASFRGREATFRAYFPDTETPPAGRAFFENIHHALYRLQSEGPLEALAVLGSVEGGLTAREALDQLGDDDRKIRYLLGSHYSFFKNEDKFFSVFFAGENRD